MKNSRTIPCTAFLVGFAIMVIELTASRIAAPIFGSSIYTWTSVIGVILLGTALGNYFGGRAIDLKNSLLTPSLLLFLSSVYIIFIPNLANAAKPILQLNFPLWLSIMLIVVLVFIVPAIFLGGIYPMLYKQYLLDMTNVGENAGKISAWWTTGSILGTFLTGFFFIGYIGSSKTLLAISLLLFASSFYLYKQFSRRLKITLLFLLCLAIYFFLSIYNTKLDSKTLFQTESNYYNIKVAEKSDLFTGRTRILFLDLDSHSIEFDADDSQTNIYTNIYPIFSIFNDHIRNIAVLGGGSLKLSENFGRFYPAAQIITAEPDPTVTQTAQKYFRTSPAIIKNTLAMDGRSFIEQSSQKFDVIFSDAYNSLLSVPWHMATQEFFQASRTKLAPEGIFAINFISAQEGPDSAFYKSLLKTFSSVFSNYHVIAYGKNPTDVQNIILIGLNSPSQLSNQELQARLANNAASKIFSKYLINTSTQNQAEITASPILTDDFAPTDKLMLPSINQHFSSYLKAFDSF